MLSTISASSVQFRERIAILVCLFLYCRLVRSPQLQYWTNFSSTKKRISFSFLWIHGNRLLSNLHSKYSLFIRPLFSLSLSLSLLLSLSFSLFLSFSLSLCFPSVSLSLFSPSRSLSFLCFLIIPAFHQLLSTFEQDSIVFQYSLVSAAQKKHLEFSMWWWTPNPLNNSRFFKYVTSLSVCSTKQHCSALFCIKDLIFNRLCL